MIPSMPARNQPSTAQPQLGLPLSIRLTPDQRTGVDVVAAARGVAVGTIIREAVVQYLEGFTGPRGETLLQAVEAGEFDQIVIPDLGDE